MVFTSIAKGFSLKASTPLFLSVFWWREQAQFKQGQLELPGANTLGYAFQPMISRVNRINNPASLPLSWEISKECFKLSQCIPVGLSCNFLNDATFIDIITFMPHFPALLLMLPDAISQIYYLSHIFISGTVLGGLVELPSSMQSSRPVEVLPSRQVCALEDHPQGHCLSTNRKGKRAWRSLQGRFLWARPGNIMRPIHLYPIARPQLNGHF